MKSFISIAGLCLLASCICSCSKDTLTINVSHAKPTNSNTFTGRDTIHCNDDSVFEYDLISTFLNSELLTIDTIQKSELGDSLYSWVSDQLLLADSIGFEAWYLQLFGVHPSSDIVDELANIQSFVENNYNSRYYGSLADSLVDEYIDDNRFNLVEKNILSSLVLYTSSVFQIATCNANSITVRGGEDDGEICYYPFDPAALCALSQDIIFAAVGAYVGQFIANQTMSYLDDWLPIVTGLFGFFFANNNDFANCYGICDDCHHPNKITLKADYFDCKYSAAQWFGNFEFAEAWDYAVFVNSGNFSGETFVTRQPFPTNFNPNGQSFVVNIRTVSDGHNYPTPIEGYSQTFSPNLPPTPFSLRGAIIANHEDNFRYKSSTSFGGNLSNPTWDVGEGVHVISTGTENGMYYIVVNFAEVTTPIAEITLTVYDECSKSNILAFIPPRLEHE